MGGDIRFLQTGAIFLAIVFCLGSIDDANKLAKQLCIVCSHNIAIGLYFEKAPESTYVGFPHFGPQSLDIPVLRTLARFWSYEMVAIRAATALRPLFIPGLWASVMSLIIPQMSVFAPRALGNVLAKDYFPNPVSFASVNGFPALIWLMWFTFRRLQATNFENINYLWVQPMDNLDPYSPVVALGLLPFVQMLLYKIGSVFFGWTSTRALPADGRTFLFLHSLFMPCYCYMLYIGWEFMHANMVLYAYASIMPIFWVNCMGGVDMWIEAPLGYPARTIAFTPTWIVSHGVFFLQWALDPSDYINRLVFLIYMCPQLVHINYYFYKFLRKDWGTMLPIMFSYVMHGHMTLMELFKFATDIKITGIVPIFHEVVKDCPLHFTPAQFAVLMVACALVYTSPSANRTWCIYSSLGPMNWFGII